MPRINIQLDKDELAKLREIAKENGFEIDRGRMVGDGSIRQLLLSIINGEYRIVSVFKIDNFDPDYHKYKIVPVCEVEGCTNQVAIKTTPFKIGDITISGDMIAANVCWLHLNEIDIKPSEWNDA